ncbi:hypothetical protein E2C01_090206 [Portunus trituberculatus]|uniref:Uncharacterized protein n=1 Tax=Portunus trituberculatus TaxID=210409 RepID=A0A5B7JRL0_PORTR|nr:hypothetical protein [Portunus trituberculatus]
MPPTVTNHHGLGRWWQIKFAVEKTQALVISLSREDARHMEGQMKFGEDTLAIKVSINILGLEVDTKSGGGGSRHLPKQ